MSRKIDLVGGRYGRLTVIKEAGRKRKEVLWECVCDCGNTVNVPGYYLRIGHTRSCGCLKELNKYASVKHGLYGSRIHSVYTNMKTRCYNPNFYLFHRYGGRGITVCDEWLGENGLKNFYEWSMVNGYSDELSIDRIDNDKGYSPTNCRWVTMKQQQNNRSTNRFVCVDGITKTLSEWSDCLGICYGVLQRHSNMDIADFIRGKLNASA